MRLLAYYSIKVDSQGLISVGLFLINELLVEILDSFSSLICLKEKSQSLRGTFSDRLKAV